MGVGRKPHTLKSIDLRSRLKDRPRLRIRRNRKNGVTAGGALTSIQRSLKHMGKKIEKE